VIVHVAYLVQLDRATSKSNDPYFVSWALEIRGASSATGRGSLEASALTFCCVAHYFLYLCYNSFTVCHWGAVPTQHSLSCFMH